MLTEGAVFFGGQAIFKSLHREKSQWRDSYRFLCSDHDGASLWLHDELWQKICSVAIKARLLSNFYNNAKLITNVQNFKIVVW